jgi:hypothetical protein
MMGTCVGAGNRAWFLTALLLYLLYLLLVIGVSAVILVEVMVSGGKGLSTCVFSLIVLPLALL